METYSAMKSYADKLLDPRFQKFRLLILQMANWKCEDCNRSDRSLQVHHCAYISGAEPWEYPAELCMSVCDRCHKFRQSREDALRVNMGKITRFLSPDRLEDEAFRLVQEMATRETERLAESFS